MGIDIIPCDQLNLAGARNVTDRARVNDYQSQLATLFESSQDAIVAMDVDGTIIGWNNGAEKIFGYTASEMVGTSILRLIPADRQNEENHILGKIRRDESVEQFETLRQTRDGRLIEASVMALPIKDAEGKVIGVSKVARDITVTKRLEAALRESQQALHLMLDSANIGYWDLNLVTYTSTHSLQHDRIFGYEELLAHWSYEWFLAHVHPEDQDNVDRLFQAGVAAKTKWDIECRIVRRDGALRWIWAHGNIFTNAAGEAVRMLGMVSDTTERKQAEAKVLESEAHFLQAQRIAKLGSWELEVQNNRLQLSDQMYEILGMRNSKFTGTYEDFLEHVHPGDRERLAAAQRATLARQAPLDIEYRIVLPDGSEKFVHQMADMERVEAGPMTHLAGIILDITERKLIEAERESLFQQVFNRQEQLRILSRQLIHAKEDERRQLAGELHDEIGQVLCTVSLGLQLTKQTLDRASAGRLDECLTLVDRVLEQVRSMSLNLRPSMLDIIGLEPTLRWFVDRQINAIGLKIDLVSSLGGNRFTPEMETACFRIVQESLTNVARHARARTVHIELLRTDSDLLLSIQDDGIGFDVAASRQRGTSGRSFGLLGMEERVRLLNGEFEIESASGKGTVTRVRLPLIA